MLKRLIIVIMFFAIGVFQAAFADGNIVAILVALRQQGVCTDSCSITMYDTNTRFKKLLKYYDINDSDIYEYDTFTRFKKLLKYYHIGFSEIYEYDTFTRFKKLLKYYYIGY